MAYLLEEAVLSRAVRTHSFTAKHRYTHTHTHTRTHTHSGSNLSRGIATTAVHC